MVLVCVFNAGRAADLTSLTDSALANDAKLKSAEATWHAEIEKEPELMQLLVLAQRLYQDVSLYDALLHEVNPVNAAFAPAMFRALFA
ncbi:pantoate kinase [Paraburkholderia youngii]|uniref:hypothetical protein n=1 Tax=Paraburkholderia youngii TaxID=2782701 RepID=UPI003D1BD4AD